LFRDNFYELYIEAIQLLKRCGINGCSNRLLQIHNLKTPVYLEFRVNEEQNN